MTLAMRDLENQEIGREEGRKEGREEGDRERIINMLKKGKTVKEIVDFCDYPYELVERISLVMNSSKI